MPSKKKNNSRYTGFYWFMQEMMPKLKQQGRLGGIDQVVPVARPLWKEMSKQEQDKYEKIAKEMKRKEGNNTFGLPTYRDDSQRLDNVGNVIAHRVNVSNVGKDNRTRNRKWASSKWPVDADDMIEVKFYFIGFEYLCKLEEGDYMPLEVSLLEWSMQNGISKVFHKFIDAGTIPMGYRYTCQQHSDETHQIPIEGFEEADNNYKDIWQQMINFVNPNKEAKDTPPLYCVQTELESTESMILWLYQQANVNQANILEKVFVLEDCVQDLVAKVGVSISEGSAIDALLTTVFDYEADTRCKWHEEREIRNCSMLVVKRYAYILSDFMSTEDKYNFTITKNHLPIRDAKHDHNIIIPSNQVVIEPLASRGRGRGGFSYSNMASAAAGGGRGNPWKPAPTSQRVDEDNGIFPARDIRYKNKPVVINPNEEDSDDDEDLESMYSCSSRKTGLSDLSADTYAPKNPWGNAAGINPFYKPDIDDDEEFPTLGGLSSKPKVSGHRGISGSKYAGRGTAPPAQVLPKPGYTGEVEPTQMWTPSTAYIEKRQELEEERSSQPSLMDMVRQKEANEKQQSSQPLPVAAGVGRGYGRGSASSSSTNAAWLQQKSSNKVGGGWNPNPASASGSNPWTGGASRGDMAGIGRGRGRGVLSGMKPEPKVGSGDRDVAKQSEQNNNQPITFKPPPGFGRGFMLNNQMNEMNLKN